MQNAYPSPSFGYYRGNPLYGGYGSNMGVHMAGNNVFAAGQGPVDGKNAGSSWTPTIMYLFVLIIAEMVVFGILGRHI